MNDLQVERFFERLKEDRALGQEYNAAIKAAVETAVAGAITQVAERHGYRFSAEAARAHLERKAGELDEEQLASVAGGGGWSPGGTLGFLSNPWVLAGIVAAAIAIPLAVSADDDDAS